VREIPNTEAVLFGTGPAHQQVEEILRNEGSQLPIHLEGRVPAEVIQERLLNYHALVLLSDYEGLPVAVMEAMACGVVPISLRTRSGITELIEDGMTGILVDDRGDAFISAVRRLAADKDFWQRLSANARNKVMNGYSSDVCADAWEGLFRELKKKGNVSSLKRIPVWLQLPPVHPQLKPHDHRRRPWQKVRNLLR
jgi:glycosyltransferase involved in cell wall biosynthesis